MVTAIKFLADEGSYKYILSGSLLGVELKDLRSVPVGYLDEIEMYPLDLAEFFEAIGIGSEVIRHLRKNYERHNALSNVMENNDYDIPFAYVFCQDNVTVKGKVVYLPIYMITFLEQNLLTSSLNSKEDRP